MTFSWKKVARAICVLSAIFIKLLKANNVAKLVRSGHPAEDAHRSTLKAVFVFFSKFD
jgi:hypothetical protein